MPEVARVHLMLRGTRLGPERKAIVLAAAGRSYNEHSVDQALPATSPHSLVTPKDIVQVVDESEGLTEGTDDTVETGLEGEELQNVVSKLHRALQEAKMVRTLVMWRRAFFFKKKMRQQDRTDISVHRRHRHVREIWSNSRRRRYASFASVWDVPVNIVWTKPGTYPQPEHWQQFSSLKVTATSEGQHRTWLSCCERSRAEAKRGLFVKGQRMRRNQTIP